MSEFARSRAMRQFYRNVFTRFIDLPEADVMPANIAAEIFSFKSANITALEPVIRAAETGLEADKDAALKNMLCAIVLANTALDETRTGDKQILSSSQCTQLTEYVVSALNADSNIHYLVAAIQLLFRVNEISSALFLINNNLSLVSSSAPVLKILLLICLMENDFNQAMVVIQVLTADAALIGEDPMALLMITCGIYRLGGIPDSYIDFRSLNASEYVAVKEAWDNWIVKTSDTKTTVLLTCTGEEYFEHAVPTLYSLYETNRNLLDVHVHVFNGSDEVKESLLALREQFPELNLSASHETIASNADTSVVSAARRIVFLRHALSTFNTPVMAVNPTVLVRKPWADPDASLLLLKTEDSPFWEDVFAGFIYARPGGVAQRYFDRVAHFIDVNLSSGNCAPGLEQVALFACLDSLSPEDQHSITRVERCAVLASHAGDEAFCWVTMNAEGPYQEFKSALIGKYQR
ncbi:hypothetical protein QCJ92_00016570 [Enterobacter roggenkampii]|uniref:hypothetical protein n=1 Tax=Enterobacter roggenkampii TaxID=1812935 RepID=UPI00303A6DFE|nr:hypothetical protein [Enterobacter roggenkampii]